VAVDQRREQRPPSSKPVSTLFTEVSLRL
jgi:hypothetical protein